MKQGATTSRRHVLVVEPYDDARIILEALLVHIGWEVTTTADGRSAIELAIRKRPDAVVCELVLPGDTDGLDVARALRRHSEDLILVALTGSVGTEQRARALAAGFDTYLPKPTDLVTLLAALSRTEVTSSPRPTDHDRQLPAGMA